MNRTVWAIIGVTCILGFAGLVYVTKKDQVNVDAANTAAIVASTDTTIGDQVYGNPNAKVVVFEYADFQCPYCYDGYKTVNTIKALYRDKIAYVFRNFPLTTIHPNAIAASSAVEAAGLQGKYWEMSDLVFANHDNWQNLGADQRDAAFISYAKQLNLNIDTFNADRASSKIQKKIQTDQALGSKSGVDSTPSFFISNQKMPSDVVGSVTSGDGSKLMDKIDQALKDAGETPPKRP